MDDSHDRHAFAHRRADPAAMDTFTLVMPRSPFLLRLWGRHSLVRASDRIEALAVVLTVVVILLTAPIAAAIGTAVYDARRHVYAEQSDQRHIVAATVTDDDAAQAVLRSNTALMPARWSVKGVEHTGAVEVPSTAKTGDVVQIWIDQRGDRTSAPNPPGIAAVEATTGALVIWVLVGAVEVGLLTVTRSLCNRVRFAAWQRELDHLAGTDGFQYPGPAAER